jgi:hypothetical protein
MPRTQPPTATIAIDISGADFPITETIAGIYCNAAGTVFVTMKGEVTARRYVVQASQVLLGNWGLVKNAGGGTTLTVAGDMVALKNSR